MGMFNITQSIFFIKFIHLYFNYIRLVEYLTQDFDNNYIISDQKYYQSKYFYDLKTNKYRIFA
jgi:hypothetical protein